MVSPVQTMDDYHRVKKVIVDADPEGVTGLTICSLSLLGRETVAATPPQKEQK